MAKLEERPKVSVEATLALTEDELRAFAALAAYDTQDVLDALAHVSHDFTCEGSHGLGLMTFLKSVAHYVPPILKRVDNARMVFNK